MRKLFRLLMEIAILVILALSLLLMGCCKNIDANGVETTSFSNCLQKSQDYVCNPSASVMVTVDAAAPVLAALLNTLVPQSAAWVNATNAISTVNTIQSGACVTVTALNNLIAMINIVNAQKGLKAGAKRVDITPLINWRATAKK